MPPVADVGHVPVRRRDDAARSPAAGRRERNRGSEKAGSTAGGAPLRTTSTSGRASAGGSLPVGPTGLPFVAMLEPRAHFAEPGDLPDVLAAELGVLLARIERAIRSIGEIGRVHVCRWGDGGEHLHWWFMARPARTPQLIGSFAAIWDDILPPVPEDDLAREHRRRRRGTRGVT